MPTTIRNVAAAYEDYRRRVLNDEYHLFKNGVTDGNRNKKPAVAIAKACDELKITPAEYFQIALTRQHPRKIYFITLGNEEFIRFVRNEVNKRKKNATESLDIVRNHIFYIMNTWNVDEETAKKEVMRMIGIPSET